MADKTLPQIIQVRIPHEYHEDIDDLICYYKYVQQKVETETLNPNVKIRRIEEWEGEHYTPYLEYDRYETSKEVEERLANDKEERARKRKEKQMVKLANELGYRCEKRG